MKAVILAAGIGSRIRPLTDNCPKSLLTIDKKTILEMMITNIQNCGITQIVFVLGYLQEQIKDHIKEKFPYLNAEFVINDLYRETNTGFSLMLVKDLVEGSGFIKFDADVVFDQKILKNLIASDYKNSLCIDKNINLDAEEIKVILGDNGSILKANKTVNPGEAIGESIGIEKISPETAKILFYELEEMMKNTENHQEYYESAYERLIAKGNNFYALDISGLKWTEIDTKEDLVTAKKIFNTANSDFRLD